MEKRDSRVQETVLISGPYWSDTEGRQAGRKWKLGVGTGVSENKLGFPRFAPPPCNQRQV